MMILLQAAVSGLLLGAVYALFSSGLTLIWGMMNFINFAHGEFVMLGMYVALFLATGVGLQAALGQEFGAVASAALAAPLVFAAAWMLHRTLIGRVTSHAMQQVGHDSHNAQVVMTLGLSLVLQNGAMILFGSLPRSIETPLATDSFELGDILVNKGQVVTFAVAVLVALGMGLWLTRSATGRSLRAAADSPRAAAYVGIDVARMHRIAFAVGAAITALSGGLLAGLRAFHPYVGLEYVIVMYAGVVLGGLSSVRGAFIGGMVIGIVQQAATLVLPQQLQNGVVFAVFLLAILLRPQGLFGKVSERI
jgi:branched-chain amino acid transport system permease protein